MRRVKEGVRLVVGDTHPVVDAAVEGDVDAEGEDETHISGDGRTLLIERPGIEEDLWLMEWKR